MSQQYSTVHFWFINKTDAISLPLTRPLGCEGYDEAGGLEKKNEKKNSRVHSPSCNPSRARWYQH